MIGFLNVYKPSGVTSNYVVQKIKKKFNIKKIGHMGTLDPIACGILPIAIGKATRLFDYSLEKTKKYDVIFDFGYTTDTLDISGEIINSNGYIPTIQDINDNIHSMIGKISQLPPLFSSKNVNGHRAYELARLGVDFELTPKEIEIFDFRLIRQVDTNRFEFSVTCSSGTYIRSIGRDFAKILGTFACMSYLERCENGPFGIDSSIKLDNLLELDNINDILISPLKIFPNFDIININNEELNKLKNGLIVPNYQIKNNTFVLFNNKLIGVVKKEKNFLKLDTYLGD